MGGLPSHRPKVRRKDTYYVWPVFLPTAGWGRKRKNLLLMCQGPRVSSAPSLTAHHANIRGGDAHSGATRGLTPPGAGFSEPVISSNPICGLIKETSPQNIALINPTISATSVIFWLILSGNFLPALQRGPGPALHY